MTYSFSNTQDQLQKIQAWLTEEYSKVSAGRASVALVDGVTVEAYGTRSPLKNVATLSLEDARTIRIAPWDKQQIKDIERALIASGIQISVSVDDQGVRASVPMVTTENRMNLVKNIKEKLEEARIRVRSVREDIWNDVQAKEKEGGMSEDEKFRAKEDLQKHVDDANKKLEDVFRKKEQEIMTV
jgi:ribosome recycling factor